VCPDLSDQAWKDLPSSLILVNLFLIVCAVHSSCQLSLRDEVSPNRSEPDVRGVGNIINTGRNIVSDPLAAAAKRLPVTKLGGVRGFVKGRDRNKPVQGLMSSKIDVIFS
jgi:hypothetical protein